MGLFCSCLHYGNAIIANSAGNKDLKYFGKIILQIGKLGREFHPDNIDFDPDLDKKLKIEHDKLIYPCLGLSDAQCKIMSEFIGEIDEYMHPETNKTEKLIVSYILQSTPYLYSNQVKTFTEVAERLFAATMMTLLIEEELCRCSIVATPVDEMSEKEITDN